MYIGKKIDDAAKFEWDGNEKWGRGSGRSENTRNNIR